MSIQSKVKRKEAAQGFLSVLPIIIILLAVRAYPIIAAFMKSFTNWDGLYRSDFVGLRNYLIFFQDGELLQLLRNNAILLLHIPVQLFLGLVFSLLLYEEVIGWKFFRSISYIPQIMSAVIIGYLFRILFATNGPINFILKAAGLEMLAIEWLGNGLTGLLVIIIAIVWQGIGWQALLIMGGLSSISPSIFDAARIDGASYWQRLFKVVLPMLVRVIEYTFVVSVMWVFTGLFSFVHSVTRGGPGYETTTIDYMIYHKAFVSHNQLGSACALAVILLILVLFLTRIQMKATDKVDDWSE